MALSGVVPERMPASGIGHGAGIKGPRPRGQNPLAPPLPWTPRRISDFAECLSMLLNEAHLAAWMRVLSIPGSRLTPRHHVSGCTAPAVFREG